MGDFNIRALRICGNFLGWEFRPCQPGEIGVGAAFAGKLQANKGNRNGAAMPALTDEQKQELAKTVKSLFTEAYKDKLASAKPSQKTSVFIFREYGGPGTFIEKPIVLFADDAPSFSRKLSRIGLSVASTVGGFVVEAGMGLLEPDVLQGVAQMHVNYLNYKKGSEYVDPLRDNVLTRKTLNELEAEERERFGPH